MRYFGLFITTVALISAGCGTAEPAPDLPPAASLELPNFFDQPTEAATGALTTQYNYTIAALAVGATTTVLYAYILAPTAMFAASLEVQPYNEGETWFWDRSYPGLNNIDGSLRGTLSERLDIEMVVNGSIGTVSLTDFVWFTGSHDLDEGNWTLFSPNENGPVMTIDWEIPNDQFRQTVFTNATSGRPGSGDTVTYELHEQVLATMEVFDARNADGVPSTFTVYYHTQNGAGGIDINGEQYCWNTFSEGQQDVPCT